MESLKVKIAGGSEDPVNVVFEGIELSEVEADLASSAPLGSSTSIPAASCSSATSTDGADLKSIEKGAGRLHAGFAAFHCGARSRLGRPRRG